MAEKFLATGATGGIGCAVCLLAAERGFVPVVGYRGDRREEARELARQCQGETLELDLLDLDGIEPRVASLLQGGAALAGVALVASPAPEIGRLTQVSSDSMAHFWRAGVLGNQRLLSCLVKSCFQPRRQGFVGAILSAAMGEQGAEATPNMGAYTVSKYGLLGVIALLRAETPWLTVRTISPGFTDTAMLDAFDDRWIDKIRAAGGISTPEQVADDLLAGLTPQVPAA